MKPCVLMLSLSAMTLWVGCGSSERSVRNGTDTLHDERASEASPTQGSASTAPTTEEKEEDAGPFFVPTEKIPVDVSVDFPVDI